MAKKKEKETLMDAAKSQMGLGVVGMAGMGTMGAMGNIPGMPCAAGGVAGAVGSGMTLVNVGRVAKTGMLLTDMMQDSTGGKKKIKDKRINKMI